MEDRHFLSDPRPVPGLPLPTWEVDILREGVDKPILTLRVDDVSLPPRQRKKKVLWRLPDSIEQIPKFGKEDKLRILELFKQQKKLMKREKRKSQTGNNNEEYSMLSAQQSLGMLSLDDDMEEENTTETATTNTSATTATTLASTNDSPKAAAPPPGFVPPNETNGSGGGGGGGCRLENGASAPKVSAPVKTEPTETKTPKNGKKKKSKKSSTQKQPSPSPPPPPTPQPDPQPQPQPQPQPKPPQQVQPPAPPPPPTTSTPISPSSNGPSSPLPPPPGIQAPATTTTSPPKPTTTAAPQPPPQPTPSHPPPPLHFFTIPPQGWNFLGEHVAKSYLELLTQGRIPELLQLYAWGAAKSLTVGGAHALCHSPQEIVQQLQSLQGMNLHLRGVLQQPTLHGGVLITVAGMCLSPPHVLPFSHTLILRPILPEGGGATTMIRGYQIQNDAFCFLTTDMGAPVQQPHQQHQPQQQQHQPQQNGHSAVGPTST